MKSNIPIKKVSKAGRGSISEALLKRFTAGDRAACARIISMIENDSANSADIMSGVYSRVGRAHRIGITGPPGAGKSTIVEKLAAAIRKEDKSVAIIAVDPTSPFSGGAILGDRIRMSSLFTDPGVFIRSMATRGSLGGLALKTKEVCDLFDAFGKDVIIIETVGVGQAELDVAQAAHTTLIVLVPESGDGIQAMKAGLMEIGDIYAVNKSDREGADRLVGEIEMMLEMRSQKNGWSPPVIKTTAIEGIGVDALVENINQHLGYLNRNNLLQGFMEENIRSEIKQLVQQRFSNALWDAQNLNHLLENLIIEVMNGRLSPGEASKRILECWIRECKKG